MELYGRCLCGLLKNYRSISLWSHVKKKELLQSSTIQYIGFLGTPGRIIETPNNVTIYLLTYIHLIYIYNVCNNDLKFTRVLYNSG